MTGAPREDAGWQQRLDEAMQARGLSGGELIVTSALEAPKNGMRVTVQGE